MVDSGDVKEAIKEYIEGLKEWLEKQEKEPILLCATGIDKETIEILEELGYSIRWEECCICGVRVVMIDLPFKVKPICIACYNGIIGVGHELGAS